jgi:predicted dehydrogenase
MDRRRFLGRAAAAAAGVGVFHIVAPHVLGGPGKTAPSDRRYAATIGLGRGMGFIRGDSIAVCDVDKNRLASGLASARKSVPKAEGYTDFRYILDRRDVDEVRVLTPPHWHALISILAAQAGKDVFCEKPLTRTIGEGRAFVEAIRRYNVGFRYGAHTEGPSWDLVSKAWHSGLLGRPVTIYEAQGIGCNFKVAAWRGMVNVQPEPVPADLDWDMYVGPAPMKPYHRHRTHGSFRGYWDYDGGGLSDMAPHVLNMMTAAIEKNATSPVEVSADAPPAHDDAVGMWYQSKLKYADGTTLVLDSGVKPSTHASDAQGRSLFIEGPRGRVYFQRGAGQRGGWVSDPSWIMDSLRRAAVPQGAPELKSMPPNVAAVTHAHRTNCISLLTNIAVRTGRAFKFDPVKEEIVGDAEANRLVNPPMRAPWHV